MEAVSTKQLLEIIGRNLRKVREDILLLEKDKVGQKIWGNPRASATLNLIENGQRAPTIMVLIKLALYYGVSLDSLFGVTDEIKCHSLDFDAQQIKTGLIVDSLQVTANNIIQHIDHVLNETLGKLPKLNAVTLLDEAKYFLEKVNAEASKDLFFYVQLKPIKFELDQLKNRTKDFEEAYAKNQRIQEYAVLEHINRTDEVLKNQYLTDNKINCDLTSHSDLPDTLDENTLKKTIGHNLKLARMQVAKMSMADVMSTIWHVTDSKNRLSEIETGYRLPSLSILLKLANLYDVSLDFIIGTSNDIERDSNCSKAGYIVQNLRTTTLNIADRIAQSLVKNTASLPNDEALALIHAVKEFIQAVKTETSKDKRFAQDFEQFAIPLFNLEFTCRQIEAHIAKYHRIIDLSLAHKVIGGRLS